MTLWVTLSHSPPPPSLPLHVLLIVTDLYLYHRTQQYLASSRSPVVSSTPVHSLLFISGRQPPKRPEFCFVHSAVENRESFCRGANIRYYPLVGRIETLLALSSGPQITRLSPGVSSSFTKLQHCARYTTRQAQKHLEEFSYIQRFFCYFYLLKEMNEVLIGLVIFWVSLNAELFIFTGTKFQVAVYVSLGP